MQLVTQCRFMKKFHIFHFKQGRNCQFIEWMERRGNHLFLFDIRLVLI